MNIPYGCTETINNSHISIRQENPTVKVNRIGFTPKKRLNKTRNARFVLPNLQEKSEGSPFLSLPFHAGPEGVELPDN